MVRGFHEKPRVDSWINGGFFCFEPAVLEYLAEDSVLEREPLERLAADGELRAFRHTGFWDCMDTYKDAVLLNDLWESGSAPWKELHRLRPPLLIVRGGDVEPGWPEAAGAVKQRLPHAEIHTIDGAGHLVPDPRCAGQRRGDSLSQPLPAS